MPLYNYHCNSCGYDGEYLSKKLGVKAEQCEECFSKEISQKLPDRVSAPKSSKGSHSPREGKLVARIIMPIPLPAAAIHIQDPNCPICKAHLN